MAAAGPEQPLPPAAASLASLTSDRQPIALIRFWGPRHWPTWLLLCWLRFAAVLPWRVAIKLHKQLGRAAGALLPGRRQIVRRNLEICFPQLDPRQIEGLSKRHFENVGAFIAEMAIAWFGSADRLAHLFRIEGVEHLQAALSRGKGVMLFSGHFTSLEICVPVVKSLVPFFAFMYRRRHNPLLNAMQSRGRLRAAHVSVANNDVRAMLRMLRKNAVVWYAPDQARGDGGALLPFFGEPAMTSTAASRLARVSGAAIIPLFFCRLPDDSGYVLRFHAPLDNLPSTDAAHDTARLTAMLEGFVRECPEQYFWIHRKFKGRSANLPDAYERPVPRAQESERSRALGLPRIVLAILGVALFIATFENNAFWSAVLQATMLDEHQGAIVISLFAILFCTLSIVLALAIGDRLFKLVAALLLVVSAATGFFMTEYGVVIDPSMIRSVVDTELREASPLLTSSFFMHLLFFGVIPALILASVPLKSRSWKHGLIARSVVILLSILALVGTLYANYGPVSYFAHQHRQVRLLINPGHPIYAYAQFLLRADDDSPPDAVRIPLDAKRSAGALTAQKHGVVIFVLGETARADRFSFNGYGRDTNLYTRDSGVINFSHVFSCGTSTADSVPCLFSQFGRNRFSHAAVAAQERLFDVFERLDISVTWRDNSTGCKDVCDPEHFAQFAAHTDADFCDSTGCFDEILLKDLAAELTDRTQDHFIVLHQRGSHGPAYYTDTPTWSKAFLPECDLPNLRNCSNELINNAYDNTILYTDFFLSQVIEFLKEQTASYDVAMFYVSDHGESLGENGLYLHGFPYAIAPIEQTHVPMLFWGSASFYARHGIDTPCVDAIKDGDYSHDAVFHTLFPLFDIETSLYRKELDLFAACRQPGAGSLVTSAN